MPRAKKAKSKARSKIKTKAKTRVKAKTKVKAKAMKASVMTAQQIKKECGASLNHALKEIQSICQVSIATIQEQAKKCNEHIKKAKARIKELHQKISDTENALQTKTTKALQNRLKSNNSKLKAFNRELSSLEKMAEKLKAQLQQVKAIKETEKAKAAAIKKWMPVAKPKPASKEKPAAKTKSAAAEKQEAAPKEPKAPKEQPVPEQQTAIEEQAASAPLPVVEQLTASALKIGDASPDVTALAHDNDRVSLSDFRGKNVVLYFYPRDNTPGCTKEALDFTDNSERFDKHDTVVLGVSRDSIASHQKFIEEHGIGCTLLSDPDEELCKAFDVIRTKNKYGKMVTGIERTTFVIDKEGVIRAIFRNVKVPGHVDKVLTAVQEL